jgi:AcrR family transcriptional regulator
MCNEPASHEPASVRERLLDAAEEVVGRDGVVNLTLDAVAKAAGVSKGGLLYHFHSKSALIVGIVERLVERCTRDHEQRVAADGKPDGAFARAYLTIRAAGPDLQERIRATALLAAAGTNPQYLDPIRVYSRECQVRLESDNIDPVAATIVRLAADGLAFCEMLGLAVPSEELRQQVVERLRTMTQPPGRGEA